MIRLIAIATLSGALLSATPVLAADSPHPTYLNPPTALEAVVSPNDINQTKPTPAPVNPSRAGALAQAPAVTATNAVTAVAAVTQANPVTAAAALTNAAPTAATPAITATAPVTSPASTQPLTSTQSLTSTTPVTAPVSAPVTATLGLTATTPATQTGVSLLDPSQDPQYAKVLQGTIIANRTQSNVRFFVEGQTYELAGLRAMGLSLPRPTGVLNLFNCDAAKSENEAGCFWDPYLLKQDGFYEIVSGAEAGTAVNLSLREAGAPPANQIWVQNRTGERESIIVNNQVTEIPPASVQEFAADGTGPMVVHVRNCITQGAQTACEWAPQTIDPGYYYALVKLKSEAQGGATLTTNKLEGVVASSGKAVEQPPQATCALRVPTLNVRSGPGLEFPVVTKVRGSEDQPGSVVVVSYDATKQWMKVTDRIAQGGWVTANSDFIICTGDLAALPVEGGAPAAAASAAVTPTAAAPAAAAPAATEAAPAAAPAAEAAAPAQTTDTGATGATAAAPAAATEAATPTEAGPTATPTAAAIPAGQARLVINNGFDQVMRFTLDQKFRPERDNLSGEWDLQPGQSISVLVYPGMIPFSASTPWRGLAGNANVQVEKDQEVVLWLHFVPDPDGSGKWILQH